MRISTPSDLYNLRQCDAAQGAGRSPLSPTRLLQHQIASGFLALRFRRELEADFCRYMRVSGRFSRILLVLLVFVATIIKPLLDTRFMGASPPLAELSRWLHLGVMVPLLTAVGVYCWRRSASRAVEPLMVLVFACIVAGELFQRLLVAPYAFDPPLELIGIAIVGMFTLARIRFWVMLPAAVIVCLITLANELLIVEPDSEIYYHLFATGALVVIGVASGYSTEYSIRWTWLNGALARYISRQDSLTGLLNRHALQRTLERTGAHARREGLEYAVAMIDIDAFGAYNDRYGHQRGDAALSRVADVLRANARRPQDVCGRYGGEEFVVLWMDGDADELRAMADATRAAVERAGIVHAASPVAQCVTVSIGLCHVRAADNDAALETVLRKADRLVYEAKAQGRNRVVSACFDAVAPMAQ